MYYLVYVKSREDNVVEIVICNETELAELLLHVDKDKYMVTEATKFADKLWNIKEFCKKDPNLETGKNN